MKNGKKIIVMMLTMIMLLTAIPVVSVQAAGKPAISAKSMQIPIGKLTKNTEWFYGLEQLAKAQKIGVKNKKKGATYSFSSSNSKIVKVPKSGGYLTGVKAGKATITCTQTLKGKKTVIGKCTVTVKKADFDMDAFDGNLALGRTNLVPQYTGFTVRYRNPDAKYTFNIDKEGLTINEVKWKASQNTPDNCDNWVPMYGNYTYLYEMNATKVGTYKVSVKETYKKKTTTVGTFNVTVHEPKLKEGEFEFLIGEEFGLENFVDYLNDVVYDTYKMECVEGQDVISLFKNESGGSAGIAQKGGTAKIKITDTVSGKEFGTVSVKVISIACESIEADPIEAEVGDDDIWISYELNPEDTTDVVSVVSKNPEIFKVVEDEEGSIYGEALKVGKTTLIITCGNQKKEIPVEVSADDYDEDDE